MSLSSVETTFILVRHGETDWNLKGKFQGHTDIPLNKTGVNQAINTAKKLSKDHPNIAAIYSSDLLRAQETAKHSAKYFNLPVEIRVAFREYHGGAAEGMTRKELDLAYLQKWDSLAQEYPDKNQRWNHTVVPNQETVNDQLLRIKKELIQIARERPSKKVAVFSHGGILRSLISSLEEGDSDRRRAIPNCSIIQVVVKIQSEESFFQLISIENGV